MKNNKSKIEVNCGGYGCLMFSLPGILTAMVGYHIHNSLFWAIVDLFFWPVAILKWIICHQINVSIIKETFAWFFQ